MSKINSGTNKIWMDNEKTLIFLGNEFKIERMINRHENLKNVRRSTINLFSIIFCKSHLQSYEIQRNITYMISTIQEEEAIVILAHRSKLNNVQICFLKEESLSELLPAIQCPSFIKKKRYFSDAESDLLLKHVADELKMKAVVIKNETQNISMYSVYSPITRTMNIYEFDCLIDKIRQELPISWQINNWVWKSNRLIIDADNIVNGKLFINKLLGIMQINEVSIYSKANRSKERIISSTTKSFPFASFSIEVGYNNFNFNKISLPWQLLTLIFPKNVFNFRCRNIKEIKKDIQVRWLEIHESKDGNLIALNLFSLKFENMVLAESNNELSEDQDFSNKIKELAKSHNGVYMIVKRKDLKLIEEFNNIDQDKNIIKYWSKAHINILSGLEKEALMKFSFIPKNLDCTFEIKNSQNGFLKHLMNKNSFRK